MSSSELKLQIINKVTAISDEVILKEIYKLVSLESDMDFIYRLTDEERKGVEAGLKDLKDGNVYSSQVAESMIQEWLKK